ncbi:MAG: hypothetical protein ACRC2R_19730 [Xenococcaceae cyanobacterium]
MSTETIKISLIHTCNRTIHEGEITLTGDYPNCGIKFISSISQNIEVKGHDYFQCLINLRIELEKQNYYLLCNGARRDLDCGGMMRNSSCGRFGYIAKLGKYLDTVDSVDVFDYAEPNLVGSVSEQEEYYNLYESSLPRTVSYSVESTDRKELFSTSTRKNIIARLCSHSDWQLLEEKSFYDKDLWREINKLWFRFSNTLEQDRWNIDLKIDNYSIHIMFTLGNETLRKTFLKFLNEQLKLSNIMCHLEKM